MAEQKFDRDHPHTEESCKLCAPIVHSDPYKRGQAAARANAKVTPA